MDEVRDTIARRLAPLLQARVKEQVSVPA